MSHALNRKFRLIALLLPLLLAACGDDSSDGPIGTGVNDAQLTILNALAEPLSALRLDGAKVTMPVAGSARGVAMNSGSHQLEAIDSNGRMVALATFDVGSGGRRTAILTGSSSGVLLLVASDTASLPAPGSAKIRIVHMAEGTSLLDAYLYEDTAVPDSSTRMLTAFSYGQGTSSDSPGYVVRPPWAYVVRVTATGSMNSLAESPTFHALSGEIWSVILSRSSTGALLLEPIREHAGS